MRASISRVGQALAFTAMLLGLDGCSPPQGAANVRQVTAGANDPEANFAVQFVNRDTLSMIAEWPNSHPAANRQWISHQQASVDPQIKTGDKLTLAVWDNDDSSLPVLRARRSSSCRTYACPAPAPSSCPILTRFRSPA